MLRRGRALDGPEMQKVGGLLMQEYERSSIRKWLISNGADPGWAYLVAMVDSLEAALQARDAHVANEALVQAFDDFAIWLGRRYPSLPVRWPEVPAGLTYLPSDVQPVATTLGELARVAGDRGQPAGAGGDDPWDLALVQEQGRAATAAICDLLRFVGTSPLNGEVHRSDARSSDTHGSNAANTDGWSIRPDGSVI